MRVLCRCLMLAGIAFLDDPAAAADEEGRMSHERVRLDGRWSFRPDPQDVGLTQGWHSVPITDGWRPADVPRNWDDYAPGGYDGVGWLRRGFTLPDDWRSSRWGLAIFGVDDSATVWINGVETSVRASAGQRFAIELNGAAKPGENTLAVRVVDRGGPGGIVRSVWLGPYRESVGELLQGPHRSQPARAKPDWARDAVIYEAYLRSSSPEGTFAGLRQRVPQLGELGVTVVWLMPIHSVGVRNRKGSLGSPYSVRDFLDVNPEFGSMADFKALLAECHQRGLKLIIDLVANHSAWDGPLFEQHPDWYTRGPDGKRVPPVPDWSDVADLNYDAPGLRDYMSGVMKYWVQEVGIDGFRCDVAGMVPLDFWEPAVRALDVVKPVLMLAEDDDPAEHVQAFNLTYDWRLWSLLGLLPKGGLRVGMLRDLLQDEDLDFPRGSLRLRFSDNHDKCAWDEPAMVRYGPDAAKAAAVITFTIPGVPLIYNGQEVGETRQLSLFEKMPIDWRRDEHGMRDFYTLLGRLRRESAALRRGTMRFRESADAATADTVLRIEREFEGRRVAIAVNLLPVVQPVKWPDDWADARTLFEVHAAGSRPPAELPPHGCWIAELH